MIAAIGKNNELGINNDLIWHLPNDLKFFKRITMGCDLVMGRKTFFSLPKLLPGRRHIVLTSGSIMDDNVVVLHCREELVKYLNVSESMVMIIGGGSIYKQFIDLADKLYLTHVDDVCAEATVFFPELNDEEWEEELLETNNDNGISYRHMLYKRKNNM